LVPRLDHTATRVADVDRSVGFYEAVLGWSLVDRRQIDTSLATLAGFESTRLDVAVLVHPEMEPGVALELVSVIGSDWQAPASDGPSHGIVAHAFAVDALDDVDAALTAAGYGVLSRDEMKVDGVGTVRVGVTRDPDGHLVQFLCTEADPG
jgi:catechol 2,3-dioxygenase-like lactoylglutathione lyase family enzyme